MEKPPKAPFSDYARYSALAFQMALSIALPTYLGLWLDGRWNLAPTGVVVGSLGGVGLALYSVWKSLQE